MAPEREIQQSRKQMQQTMDLIEHYLSDLPGRLRNKINADKNTQQRSSTIEFQCKRSGVDYTIKAAPNMPHLLIYAKSDILDNKSQQQHTKTDQQLQTILKKKQCQDAIQYGLTKRLVSDRFDWAYLTTNQGTIHGVELRGLLFAYSTPPERSTVNRSILAIVNHLKQARAFLHHQVGKFS